MAEPSKSSQTSTSDGVQESARRAGTTVVAGAQDAAEIVRATAEQVAARLPDAMSNAQVAARDTQRALESMPNQALVVGASFSLGLGVGLFVSGANRLLVALALAPAGAMALTMIGREDADSKSSARRAASRGA